ncbi:hypothetical protein IMCC14465_07850 [alpha proteobacterium IMCC14465]|uniref:Transcriptional regulator n=1 Tax=alpha proteobacterium IMCC14465 TaxID=1220535 RepID=J9DZ74_9PROT|nr:hypothetical protein IMCC14465_07850 [alpha proteobacterium IMCC14465]
MLFLSRKTVLALETVVDVALHSRPDPVQAKDITHRQNVPQRYLEQIMQTLVKADILRGVRGPKGGYRLARERRKIFAGEVVRVIAEIEQAENEASQKPADNQFGAGISFEKCVELESEFLKHLDSVSIDDICLSHQNKTSSRSDTSVDFNI